MALLRWLPAATFVATFGFFFVDKGREARTVLTSWRGLVVVGAMVLGYVVVTLVLRRAARQAWMAPVAAAVLVLVLATWTIRPYYVDETVSRRLVADVATTTPESMKSPSGELRGIGHDAAGTVRLVRDEDGRPVVRFEQFDIEGSPDPQVHLIEGADVRKPGGAHLGRLAGNRGDVLDYAVPAGVEPSAGWTVLVWCRRFAVPIANATLAA